MILKNAYFVLFWGLIFSQNSFAYYSLMDTAELIEDGHYNANIETQFITDGESGVNLIGHFDSRLNEETGYRIEAGFGVVDFNLAAFYKWSPIPDTETQPAMSISGGVSVARYTFDKKSENDLSLRIHPIISKNFNTYLGLMTPYGGIPIGLRTVDGDMDLVAQLTLGSQLKPLRFKNMSFMGELSFDLKEAFTYIGISMNLNIDPQEGIKFE
jgi:hypothetical protein